MHDLGTESQIEILCSNLVPKSVKGNFSSRRATEALS